jgi:hypothetical protein
MFAAANVHIDPEFIFAGVARLKHLNYKHFEIVHLRDILAFPSDSYPCENFLSVSFINFILPGLRILATVNERTKVLSPVHFWIRYICCIFCVCDGPGFKKVSSCAEIQRKKLNNLSSNLFLNVT